MNYADKGTSANRVTVKNNRSEDRVLTVKRYSTSTFRIMKIRVNSGGASVLNYSENETIKMFQDGSELVSRRLTFINTVIKVIIVGILIFIAYLVLPKFD